MPFHGMPPAVRPNISVIIWGVLSLKPWREKSFWIFTINSGVRRLFVSEGLGAVAAGAIVVGIAVEFVTAGADVGLTAALGVVGGFAGAAGDVAIGGALWACKPVSAKVSITKMVSAARRWWLRLILGFEFRPEAVSP